MRISRAILQKSLVKPFYRQHSIVLVVLFIFLFSAIGLFECDGPQFFHFSMSRGMHINAHLIQLVIIVGILYAKITEQFAVNKLQRPEYSFLQLLLLVKSKELYWLLVWVQFLVFIPIIIYLFIFFAVGIYLHAYLFCLFIPIYLTSIMGVCVRKYFKVIQHSGNDNLGRNGIFFHENRVAASGKKFVRIIRRIKNYFGLPGNI